MHAPPPAALHMGPLTALGVLLAAALAGAAGRAWCMMSAPLRSSWVARRQQVCQPPLAALRSSSLPAGFWAAATAAFNRGYQATVFKEESRWRLLLLWPLLLLTNAEFRQQFWAAVRGRRSGGQQASSAPPSAQF